MAKYLDQSGLTYFWGKLKALFEGKVDKVTGKGLSTEDFTTTEKAKLADLENYTLPVASTTLGGVKTTSNVSDVTNYTPAPIVGGIPYYRDTTYSAASANAAGLMSAADYAKLAAFDPATTYAKKSDISSVYRYKGSVANYAALPNDAVEGDVYNTEDTGMNYAWTGTTWDSLGGSFDIAAITTGEIDTMMAG